MHNSAVVNRNCTYVLGVVTLVHILTLDITPAVEVRAIVQLDMTAVRHIDHTTLTGGISRLITTTGCHNLTTNTDSTITYEVHTLFQC